MAKNLLLLFMLGAMFSPLKAQNLPIVVSTNVSPPYPQTVDEVVKTFETTNVTIRNTDQSRSYSIKLSFRFSSFGRGGLSIASKPEARPTRPIDLGPGQILVLSGVRLRSLYSNYGTGDLDINGINEEELLNNPSIPEGVYQICLQAQDYNTNQALSQPNPQGCSNPMTVVTIDPPILTAPFHKTEIFAQNPQFVNFQWIPVTFNSPRLRYRLRIIDLSNLNINIYDAFESPNFLFYEKQDIMANTFQFGPAQPPLDTNHRYAVRVQAYLIGNELNIRNQGWSDVHTFIYKPTPIVPAVVVQPVDSNQVEEPPEEPALYDCNSPCLVDISNQDKTPITTIKIGDLIKMGNYNIELSQVSYSGNAFSGKGLVRTENSRFFGSRIKVTLDKVKVNAQKVAFEGSAKARKRQGSWIDDTWTDLTGSLDFNDLGQNPEQTFQNLSNEDYYLDKLTVADRQLGISVPVGYGTGDYKLQIVGINFLPTKASMNLVAMVPMPDDRRGERHLTFGVKDVCITPGGPALSDDDSYLYLTNTISFEPTDELKLTFNKGQLGGDKNSGTFLAFDCSGVKQVSLAGSLKFSPEIFIPEDDKGTLYKTDTLVADFSANFESWSDWIATLDFNGQLAKSKKKQTPYFQYKKLENYTFKVNNAVFDHSDLNNDAALTFPEGYTGADKDSPLWGGLFIKDFEVRLPRFMSKNDQSAERIKIQATQFLVDATGLSSKFAATKLLKASEGSIGNWQFSIDTLNVAVVSNNIKKGRLTGGLKLPITDSLVSYVADIDYAQSETKHFFRVKTNEQFSMSMWQATASFEPNSKIDLTVENGEALIVATLHGSMDLAETLDNVPGMELKNIQFENTIVRNQKKPKYVEFGYVKTDKMGKTPMVAGFAIGVGALAYVALEPNLNGLEIPGILNLSGNSNSIGGETTLVLKNKLIEIGKNIDFKFDGIDIKRIELKEIDLGAVAMGGYIEFFKNDAVFGSGFEGMVNANFIGGIGVTATALFGKTKDPDPYRYFFVDAKATFMPSLGFASPVFFYGFGGGFFYNLTQKTPDDPTKLSAKATNFREKYEPSKGKLGIRATVVMGLAVEETFNGDVTLEVGLNTNTWGITHVSLMGEGYSMVKIKDRAKAPVALDLDMTYHFPTKIFDATLVTVIKAPYKKPKITGGGVVRFYRDPNLWFFKAGTPSEPIKATAEVSSKLDLEAKLYLMMGQQLEAPIIPQPVVNFLGQPNIAQNSGALVNGGSGFAAGFNLQVEIDDIDLKICKLDLLGIAGFDINVLDYSSCTCNGYPEFGFNQWYANGIGYLLVNGNFKVLKTKVLSTTIGGMIEGAFPAPSGFKARVKAQFTFLGKPFDVNHQVEIGEMCEMEPGVDANGDPIVVSSPAEEFDLITSLMPENGATGIDLFTEPLALFGVEIDETLNLEYPDGQGGVAVQQIRFKKSHSYKESRNNAWWNVNDYTTYFNAETENLKFASVVRAGNPGQNLTRKMLKPQTQYYVEVKVNVQEFAGGQWRDMTYNGGDKAGQKIEEFKRHYFTTGGVPLSIPEQFVDFSKPYNRQRYLTWGDLNQGTINFNVNMQNLFQYYNGQGYSYRIKFSPLNGSAPPIVQNETVDPSFNVWFTMPELQATTTYKMEFIAYRSSTRPVQNGKGTNFEQVETERVLYTSHFRTSKYKFMNQKIQSLALGRSNQYTRSASRYGNDALVNFNNYNYLRFTITGGERFDVFDVEGHNYSESGSFTGKAFEIKDGFSTDYLNCANPWFKAINSRIFTWKPTNTNAYNQMVQSTLSNIGLPNRYAHVKDFSFQTYTRQYRYVDLPLGDAEVGLTTPQSSSASSSSGAVGFIVPFGGFNTRTPINPVILEVDYLGELQAKRAMDALLRLEQNYRLINYPHTNFNPNFQPGAYPFTLNNDIFHGSNPSAQPISKTININL